MKVSVCDAVMGSGKTQAAITMMNKETGRKFLFVTQFLDECKRVEEACPQRQFKQPQNVGDGKLMSLNDLLRGKHNIVSTHALFYKYTCETLNLIRTGHYTLILDEVIDVLDFLDLSPHDVDLLFKAKVIAVEPESNRVVWLWNDYKGRFNDLRLKIESGCVTYEDNRLMVWKLPLEMFAAFDEVIILTYMFNAQYQAYYYEMHGVDINYIGVRHIEGLKYEFTPGLMRSKISLPTIHLCANTKMNAVGDKEFALSSSWHNSNHAAELVDLKRNLTNFFKNKCEGSQSVKLWSSYKASRSALKGLGYTKCFLPYNTRATNAYRRCAYLAYTVNVFADVDTQLYFNNRGYTIDSDKLATSEMVQWLWRSRLRDGKEIWLYLPSSRMRRLLYKWVEEVTGNVDCIKEWK